MTFNNFRCVMLSVFGLIFLVGQNSRADLWGSGAYQGAMSCPYDAKPAKAASNQSDDERDARADVTRMKAELKTKTTERKRAENKQDVLRRKIERYFDSSVVEFLLDTHIENNKSCDSYIGAHPECNPQAVPPPPPPPPAAAAGANDVAAAAAPAAAPAPAAPPVACGGYTEVPEILKDKWSGPNGYCAGSGSVKANICNDVALRASDRHNVNVSDCSRALSDYRKNRQALATAASREERLNDDITDRQYDIADAREQAALDRELAKSDTESGCEECDAAARGYSVKPKRDWLSTAVNVAGGIGLLYYGKKVEESANSYNALAGYPSTQSYGYPFYQAGISGVINGLVGPGAYGCSGGLSGSGFPYGAGGAYGLNGSPNGFYGPGAAVGGAFGYQPGQYGSPWGGGAYNPGVGYNGVMNGPNGGFNIGGQFGYPNNGMMCLQAPCYGQSPFGVPQIGQIGGQFGIGNQFNPYGSQFGMNGQLSAQYQLQMLQQQQQMQQAYYQQQQAYYQAQMQQQMALQQQQYQRQQQQYQIQMQMAQLNLQLQQLQQGSYYGGTGYLGGISGGVNLGGSLNGSFNIGGVPTAGGFIGPSGVDPYSGYNYGGTTGYNPYFPNPANPGGTIPIGGATTLPGSPTRGR